MEQPDVSSGICPLWCTGVHELDDDLVLTHRSDPATVPAVERIDQADGTRGYLSTVEVVVGLERSEEETWVWIGPSVDSQRAIILTVESATRVARALATMAHRDLPRG